MTRDRSTAYHGALFAAAFNLSVLAVLSAVVVGVKLAWVMWTTRVG